MKKYHIILDLDQTLISAEPAEEYNFKQNKNKAKNFVYHNMDGYYIIFERPGLQTFLTYIFDNFIVSIWTAATKDYALFVIDKIIIGNNSNRKLDFIFFNYHCDISDSIKKGTKDLAILWDEYKIPNYNKKNTFILDDYKEDVHKIQPRNCILAKPFEFTKENSEKDDFLIKLTNELRIVAETCKNNRDITDDIVKINSKFKHTNHKN